MFAGWKVQTKNTHQLRPPKKKQTWRTLHVPFCEKKIWKKDKMLQDGSPMIVVHGVMGPPWCLFHPYKWSSRAVLLRKQGIPMKPNSWNFHKSSPPNFLKNQTPPFNKHQETAWHQLKYRCKRFGQQRWSLFQQGIPQDWFAQEQLFDTGQSPANPNQMRLVGFFPSSIRDFYSSHVPVTVVDKLNFGVKLRPSTEESRIRFRNTARMTWMMGEYLHKNRQLLSWWFQPIWKSSSKIKLGSAPTVDGSEIRANHLGWIKPCL